MKKMLTLLSVLLLCFFVSINTYAGTQSALDSSLIQEGKSQSTTQITYQSFKTTLDKHLQANPQLFDSSKNKDIVVFLGKTGAGKSTLINYLSEKELVVNDMGDIILKNPEDKSAMKIGVGASSQTQLPQFVSTDDLLFYDLPGLNATEGALQELINASFIKHIIEQARTTRIVVVAGLDEVTSERGHSFKELVSRVNKLLPSNISITRCSSCIITRSDKPEGKLIEYLGRKVDEGNLYPWIPSSSPRISQMSKPKSAQDESYFIDLNERKSIIKTIKAAESIAISKINTQVLCSGEVSNNIKDVLKEEMLSLRDKLVEKVKGQISAANDKISLERIDISKLVFQGNLEGDIASSKLVVLLKPFLDEAGYLQVFSSLEITSYVDSLKSKLTSKIKEIELKAEQKAREIAEQARLAAIARAEAEARARAEAQRIAEEQRIAAAKAEQERLAAVARAEAEARARAEAQRIAEEQRIAAAKAEQERKENDPRNWPVSVERREDVSTYWSSPYIIRSIREWYDRGRWKSDGQRWPYFQKEIRVISVKERTIAKKQDGSQFIIRQDWHEASKREEETGQTRRTGSYEY